MAGLRERKKQQTRWDLSTAAIRLCLTKGWAHVTVEDIAAEAGVSVRTVGNYFPGGKAEILAARHADRMRDVTDALAARPPGEPLIEAVTGAVLPQFTVDGNTNDVPPDPAALRAIRVMIETPELHAATLHASRRSERPLAEVIAARTGADPGDVRPALTAAVLVAAIGFAMERWLLADPPVALAPLLREVLGHVATGFENTVTEGEQP